MWSDREGYQDERDDACPYCGDLGEMAFRDFAVNFPGLVDDLIDSLWGGAYPDPLTSVPCGACEEIP